MNRRDFIRGGGIFGVVAAAVALAKTEALPVDHVAICKDSHVLDAQYIKHPAIQVGQNNYAETKSLVPCTRCGVLVAVDIELEQAPAGTRVFTGYEYRRASK